MHGLYSLAHHLTFSDFWYREERKKLTSNTFGYNINLGFDPTTPTPETVNFSFHGAPAVYKLTVSRVCKSKGSNVNKKGKIDDTGYPHDGRADNTAYRHDRRADKWRYPHDREIDIQMLKNV